MHASQGGLLGQWRDRTMARYVRKWPRKTKDAAKKGYDVTRLNDLSFAFYILIVGLGASLFAFSLEAETSSPKMILSLMGDRGKRFHASMEKCPKSPREVGTFKKL